jgi:hypothetical protein
MANRIRIDLDRLKVQVKASPVRVSRLAGTMRHVRREGKKDSAAE